MTSDDKKLSRIPLHELERRWKLVRDHLVERGLDALIVQNAKDFTGGYVKWFTDIPAGYPRTVIFHANDLMSVIEHGPRGRRRELDGADRDNPGVGEIHTTAAFPSVAVTQDHDAEIVCRVIKDRSYRSIGLVAPGSTPYGFIVKIQQELAGSTLISDETEFLDRCKAVKGEVELEWIKKAAALQDAVFERILQKARPGMRDLELTAIAQFEGQLLGSEQGIFLGSSARKGTAGALSQRHFQGRSFGSGDYFPLLIENNGAGGFYCELARTIVFGRAPQELREGLEIVKEAQQHTVSRLKPGASCAEIFQSHCDFMSARRLPLESRLYGHSQGYDLVERPILRDDETLPIEAHMNMAVHPSNSSESVFNIICDNYIVGSGGVPTRIHRTPQEIFELN